jgi:hypothetical protein
MDKNRRLLLIIAVIGMIGTFLPWARLGPLTVSGARGDGWFTFVFFGIAGALCLFRGEKTEPLGGGAKTGITVMGILGFLFGLWKIIRFTGSSSSQLGAALGIGLWVIVIAGAAIIYFNIFKKKGAEVAEPVAHASVPPPEPKPAPTEPVAPAARPAEPAPAEPIVTEAPAERGPAEPIITEPPAEAAPAAPAEPVRPAAPAEPAPPAVEPEKPEEEKEPGQF